MRFRIFPRLFCLLAATATVISAQSEGVPVPAAAARSPATLRPPAHSQWGFILLDARTGKTLAENGSHRFLTPASVVKLFTTAFAVDKLGVTRRFPTVLYRTGPVENGVLRGNLWIRGGGNPALGSTRSDTSQSVAAFFDRFAQALEKAGIREIEGGVIGDAGLIPAEAPAPGYLWEDVGNYYGAAPSGLCFHDNAYVLKLDGAAEKGHALSALGTDPKQAGISGFQVTAVTSDPNSGDSCNILGAFWNTPRLVIGTCPAGKQPLEIKGSLPDPAWTCAREFEDFLRARKIEVKGSKEIRGNDALPKSPALPADTVRMAEHPSPTLIELVATTLGYSDNLYAAQLLALAGDSESSSGGLSNLKTWLSKTVPGADAETHLVDGNGLSRRDELTPMVLARALAAFSRKPWFPAWRETLLGGNACPLKPASYADGLFGKVWLKTGSMGGVASLTGFIQGKSGRLLAFAILANHFDESPTAVRNRWNGVLRAWQNRY